MGKFCLNKAQPAFTGPTKPPSGHDILLIEYIYRAARAATPMAKTLPSPAAMWDAAPVNVAGGEVVTVPLVLAVAVALGLLVQPQSVVYVVAIVVPVALPAAADDVLRGADEAGEADEAAEEAGGADVAELELARAAQTAWAAVRVLAASVALHLEITQLVAALWMAASLAVVHWQARSLAPQEVAELTAAAMQG